MQREFDAAELRTLRDRFAQAGFVRVPNFLDPDLARACIASIDGIRGWRVALSDQGGEERYLDVDRVPPNAITSASHRARTEFQFFFELCELTDGEIDDLPSPWRRLRIHIQSAAFHNFCCHVGNFDEVAASDGIVSRIRAEHFVGLHWDKQATSTRVRKMAYVLALMDHWGADWGGATLLWNDEMSEAVAIRPVFNTLLAFALPRPHSIEPLAAFMDTPRIVVSGFVHCPR